MEVEVEVLGQIPVRRQTSLARLRDRLGNMSNWPPNLLSQQWSYPRSTTRLSHAGQEAAETSGLSLQRSRPFRQRPPLSVHGTAEALVSCRVVPVVARVPARLSPGSAKCLCLPKRIHEAYHRLDTILLQDQA